MDPLNLTVIILFNILLFYFSYRKVKKEYFKKIIKTVDSKEIDLELIQKNLENDKRYYVESLDPNNIQIVRKFTIWNAGYAYLLHKNNGKVDIYYYERNMMRRLLRIQFYETNYMLRRDMLLG